MSEAPRIKLLAMVPYAVGTSPSQRFRIEQWEPRLREAGIDLEIAAFAGPRLMQILHKPGRSWEKGALALRAVLGRASLLAQLVRFDAVLIHRAICLFGPAWFERVVAATGRPIIFDFDDAIYLLHTTMANRALGWLKFPGKTAALCRLSRHVVVANEGLADYARRYNRRVTVVPSSVDTERFRPRPRAASERLQVGWTGSSTSLTHLEWFAPVLRELLTRCDFVLHVHSDRQPLLPDVPYVWHRWEPETEADVLAQFDVGIMPMPDDPWSQGKSAMKALLYMAMGIPAVCSAVGTNVAVIKHGQNGLLARTPVEWTEAIVALAADGALRARLGEAGRQTVERQFSSRHCADAFAAVVRETVS